MSILIKALKQAERDHLARTNAASPAPAATAVLEAEPLPLAPPPPFPIVSSGEALSLEPVEAAAPALSGNDALADEESSFAPSFTTPADSGHDATQAPTTPGTADHGLLMNYESPKASGPRAEDAPPPPAPAAATGTATGTAPTSGYPRPLAAVLQTNEPVSVTPGSARAPAAPAAGTPPTAARDVIQNIARGAPAARPVATSSPNGTPASVESATAATPAAAAATDAQAEHRKAARQLMGAAPNRTQQRRIAIVLGVIVLFAGAVGAAYWQGLLVDLEGLLPGTSAPTPANTRSLADRLQPVAPVDASAKPRIRTAAPGERAGAKAPDGRATSAAVAPHIAPAAAAPAPGNTVEAPRAGDSIHLRPPEATPERIRALLQDAYAAAGRGENAVAERLYQQVNELDHNNGDAWIGLAALAANNGDSAGANRAYRRALEIDPSDSIALGGLLGLQSNVDPQEAETRLRLLIVHDGAQPALLAALGKMIARQGRWLEAQETFFKAWAADPTQPDVAFNLAVTLERIRQPLPALSFYQRALELAQSHSRHFDPAVAQERVAALTPKKP